MLAMVKMFIEKFGFDRDFDSIEKIDFALDLISEEYHEVMDAYKERDAEEFVDGLGDLSWLIDKLMLQLEIDPLKVREEIGRANLSKERGIKPGREQSGGFDVIKPRGWKGPNHSDNHGKLDEIFKN